MQLAPAKSARRREPGASVRDVAASRRSAPPARRAVISPLLSNIYLDPLDKLMAALGFRMVRDADDPGSRWRANLAGAGPVILCQSREDADSALAEVRAWVAANGLTLHPDKTHIGDCRIPGQGFEFVMAEGGMLSA